MPASDRIRVCVSAVSALPACPSPCWPSPRSCPPRPRRPHRQGARPRRRRSPPTPWRSRCRSIRRSWSARCPTGCATTCGRTRKPARRAELRLVVKAGSVLEDDDQQGLAHFVEHMQFEGTRHFPGQQHQRLPVVARPEHRRGRERGDQLRRHAVHAARADRRARARSTARCSCSRTGPRRRHVRSGRHRAPARHRARRVADAPRRRRAHRGQDPARAARGIALRGPLADRQARDHPERAARPAAAVLSRLVPAGPDGGDRRRRRRPQRRRRR